MRTFFFFLWLRLLWSAICRTDAFCGFQYYHLPYSSRRSSSHPLPVASGVRTPTTGLALKKKEEIVTDFVSHIQDAIQSETFVSLTMHGASNKKRNSKKITDGSFRGSIRQVHGRLIQMKKDKSPQLQLTIKFHGATDICKNMELKTLDKSLSTFLLEPPISEWGVETSQPFQGVDLVTIQNIWTITSLDKIPKVHRKDISPSEEMAVTAAQPTSHDRTKQVPLETQDLDTSYLQALGLSKSDGSPRPGMSSKLRQCNKFVEIVSGLIDKASIGGGVQEGRRIRIVDMGCGRGYLTFALHSYLRHQRYIVESTGIDVRPKLVAEISSIAQSLGGIFDTLSFKAGTIEEIVSGSSMFDRIPQQDGEAEKDEEESSSSLDILIALHACDTATDDALWSGISQKADIIVVAPCCHKQIRSQVDAHLTATKKSHPMYDILKYGVYRERISETVTDSLRALLLEEAGYKVQVFEFIGGEHTSKNVMITAVKTSKSPPKDTLRRIKELATLHGIGKQRLANWMGVELSDDHGIIPTKPVVRAATQMPPKNT